MQKTVIIYLFMPFLLLAYSDADFDGVSDEHDLCPNSTMLDIVDNTGCTIEKLIIPKIDQKSKENQHHMNMMLGFNYIQNNETINESFLLDYHYKNSVLKLQTNHYENGGQGDTIFAFSYKFQPQNNFSYYLGTALILPTYDSNFNNNNIDYRVSLNFNYQHQKISYFGGLNYTIINDNDINTSKQEINFQNSQSYYFGFGSQFIKKLYSSISYASSSSIYKNGNNLNSLSFYNYYSIDKNWFTTFSYIYGISNQTSEQFNLNLGYHF